MHIVRLVIHSATDKYGHFLVLIIWIKRFIASSSFAMFNCGAQLTSQICYEDNNLFYLRFYLTTLTVAQTLKRRMIGWLMKNEFEGIWKEAVVA
jgi:hypothetical protein